MLLSVYESTCCCSPSPTRAPQVPEAELDSLVARLAAEMVVSVELLRDCWAELQAALPAVARAKIGAALRAQPSSPSQPLSPSPRRDHPSPAYRALPAAAIATGGARPRAGGGTAAPRRRKPSNSLAALREWRNGLSHREPREPQRAQTVNV